MTVTWEACIAPSGLDLNSQYACFHLGQKSGLQQRLTQQEESMLNIKAELLRLGFAQQSLQTEKVIAPFMCPWDSLILADSIFHFHFSWTNDMEHSAQPILVISNARIAIASRNSTPYNLLDVSSRPTKYASKLLTEGTLATWTSNILCSQFPLAPECSKVNE